MVSYHYDPPGALAIVPSLSPAPPDFPTASVSSNSNNMSFVSSFDNQAPASAFPPPQTLATEDVQISFDTEMIDEDEAMALAQQEQRQQHQGGAPIIVEPTTATGDAAMEVEAPAGLAPEKVHLRGVDTMTTDDVKSFANKWVAPGIELVKIEWIDDSSCNIVYPDSTIALQALNALASGEATVEQQRDLLLLRQARSSDSHPDARLEVRIAKTDDQKIRGARERSRFYLFNPEHDHVERNEQRRRERDHNGRRQRRGRHSRGQSVDSSGEGGYNRRYYDQSEQDRRTRGGATLSYDISYDDDPDTRSSRPTQSRGGGSSGRRSRNRSRTRSRSPPSRYREQDLREREFFRSQRTPPPSKPRAPKNIELFPETLTEKRLMRLNALGDSSTSDPLYNPLLEIAPAAGKNIKPPQPAREIDLFPSRAPQSTLSFSNRDSNLLYSDDSQPTAPIRGQGGALSLEERIHLQNQNRNRPPPSSSASLGLESRISLPQQQQQGQGESIKGRASAGARDLFPEKLGGSGSGGDLMDRIDTSGGGGGGGNGRRRGRKRAQAQDMFG